MDILNKVKDLAEKTVEATKSTIQNTRETYKDGGLEAVGFKAGKATKELVSDVSEYANEVAQDAKDYANEVAKEAKKAGKPAGIAFNNEQPTAKAAAKIALGVIAGIRKVGIDTVEKIKGVDEPEKQEEIPPKTTKKKM